MSEKMEGFFRAEPEAIERQAQKVEVPSASAVPVKECRVVISYPAERPDLLKFSESGGVCAGTAEVALAVMLSALLRSGFFPVLGGR